MTSKKESLGYGRLGVDPSDPVFKKPKTKKELGYENLVATMRKKGFLTKYVGLADAHGIEIFISEAEYNNMTYPIQMRADANRQRHAVSYVVELTEDRVAKIKKLLGEQKFKKALTELKKQAVTIGLSGKGGGKLSELVKTNLTVESDDMLTIETMHLLICHLITTLIRSDGTPKFSY